MYITSYIVMPPLTLLLSKFATLTHYMRYSPISCSAHPENGWLGSFINISVDIVSSYRPFLGTTYQRLSSSFQMTFSHSSHSLFFFSFLEFFRVSCFLVCYISIFLTAISNCSWCILFLLFLLNIVFDVPT